ncbi:MAG: hypothetical protein ACOCZQ_00660 [Nanoarchaeota archaeon]
MFEKKSLKRFYRPTLMKITFWILFFSLINMFLYSIRDFSFIPCKKLAKDELVWSLCPLDPTVIEKTLYFGAGWLDIVYMNIIWPFLFIVVFGIFVPYTISCAIIEGWEKYVKNNNQ